MSSEDKSEKSAYEKYKQRINNPKPPTSKDIIHLSQKGRKEYMSYVKKAYQMMFFWIGFGGVMGYLSFTLAPTVAFLRNRPSFKKIRWALTILPLCVFPYHGIKFMVKYKRKGVRQVAKDPTNLISEEEYQAMIESQSKVINKAEQVA